DPCVGRAGPLCGGSQHVGSLYDEPAAASLVLIARRTETQRRRGSTTMCDYSLMAVPNRLAQEGEELVTHRFPTGSLGLASPADLKRAACPPPSVKTIWDRLREFFNPPKTDPVCAVCIPPGARLELQGLPVRLQHEFAVGPVEVVTFP